MCTEISGRAEIHGGKDRLSEREDGSSLAPTPTTETQAASEVQQAQARREARSDRCMYSLRNCAEVFLLRSDKMKNKKQRSARIQFAAMNFLRVILARKPQKCA